MGSVDQLVARYSHEDGGPLVARSVFLYQMEDPRIHENEVAGDVIDHVQRGTGRRLPLICPQSSAILEKDIHQSNFEFRCESIVSSLGFFCMGDRRIPKKYQSDPDRKEMCL